ncbi:glutamine-hydrolyzing carbamoyl-phosphate synthase small subunit [Desulfitibacter alkalitolerans]|uniref:glutamine-hydrolyzing carbamoyl-phosphate synthase small subunit n=1 Tax=Desulfitibacter alkalitolerans TaxID=264641 RepID=UPI0004888269|nr:glutamine-hydrolyzing carbamoyl-phosphate synthase small subunit [Desulfitibacter alkalitolerans]
MKAVLVLEDGTVFQGISCGINGEAGGEVVFSTAMTGYQEIISDPSFAGQLITLTYPLVGNYGMASRYQESANTAARGIIIKEETMSYQKGLKGKTLQQYLEENRLIGIKGVDTRTLTRHIRTHGSMRGIISTKETPIEELLQKANEILPITEQNLVDQVTTPKKYTIPGGWPAVAVLDFGVKSNIIRSLNKLGCTVIVFPAHATPEEIKAAEPDGLLLSNGPGDPMMIPHAIDTVKSLLNSMPVMGICMGHQILGTALGARTYKMKFGHRGGNQPVKDLQKDRVFVTSQNHGFCLSKEDLPDDVVITHINLNDGSIEGIKHGHLPVFSIQFHPEGAPGPKDTEYLFKEFMNMISLQGGGSHA